MEASIGMRALLHWGARDCKYLCTKLFYKEEGKVRSRPVRSRTGSSQDAGFGFEFLKQSNPARPLSFSSITASPLHIDITTLELQVVDDMAQGKRVRVHCEMRWIVRRNAFYPYRLLRVVVWGVLHNAFDER